MADRNLPIVTGLPSAPPAYSQQDQDSLRLAIRQHWHPGDGSGSGGPVTAFATVLLPLDNGSDVLSNGMYVTAPITFGYTIVGYRVIEDCGFEGSVLLRVDYATAEDFPTFTEISGTQAPQLLNSREQQRTTLDGWTATVGEAYSHLRATVVGGATALTRVVLAIALQRTDSVVNGSSSGGGGGSTTVIVGSVWSDGSGPPSDANGSDGDYYLNDLNGDVYHKVDGVWVVVANLSVGTVLDPLWNDDGDPLCSDSGNTIYSG